MVSNLQIQYQSKNPVFLVSACFNDDCCFKTNSWNYCRGPTPTFKKQFQLNYWAETVKGRIGRSRRNGKKATVCGGMLFPIDFWAAEVDSSAIATQLSAFSLLPYLGFLYFITKSKSAPTLTLFGFYFLLAFVGAASKSSSFFLFNGFLVFCAYGLCVFWTISSKRFGL